MRRAKLHPRQRIALTNPCWRAEETLNRRFLAAEMRAEGILTWPVLLTYADTSQGHTGAIYKATNWRCDGPVPAADQWLSPSGRLMGRKRGGRTRTVAEMLAAGFTRRRREPKIRYVIDRRQPPRYRSGAEG